MTKAKPKDISHTIIKCVDCGAEREIRNQDKHQVTRCKECQRAYRLKRRNELREICKDIHD